jgi:hypothetical protein
MQQHQFISIFTYLFVPKCNLIIHQISRQFKALSMVVNKTAAAAAAAAEAAAVQQLLLLQHWMMLREQNPDSLATLVSTKIS